MVAPVIVTGVVVLKYWEGSTVSPAKVDANLREWYALLYATAPGITIAPSAKIWPPCWEIWFWRADCNCVNSLAWIAKPGRKSVLTKLSVLSKSS